MYTRKVRMWHSVSMNQYSEAREEATTNDRLDDKSLDSGNIATAAVVAEQFWCKKFFL